MPSAEFSTYDKVKVIETGDESVPKVPEEKIMGKTGHIESVGICVGNYRIYTVKIKGKDYAVNEIWLESVSST